MTETLDAEERDHSFIGASGISRWSACPGSVNLQKKLAALGALPDTGSEFADLGTAAHEIAARALSSGQDAWEFFGHKVKVANKDYEVDAEMIENVQVFLDAVRGCMGDHDTLMIETPVSMPDYSPDLRGTADAIVLHRHGPEKAIYAFTILDLKYGEGVAVEGAGNEQLRYYAAAAWFTLGDRASAVSMVTMKIVQPRIDHELGPVRGEALTVHQLGEWLEERLLPAVKRTQNPGAPCVPGDYCQFCPVALYCAEVRGPFAEMVAGAEALPEDEKDDPELFKPMTSDELGRLTEMIPRVKRFIKALEKEVFVRLRDGGEVPGFKLVEGRSDRTWREGADDLLKAAFGDDAFNEPKLRSPAQIEKLGPEGKSFVVENAYKPPGGLTFAPVSDRRAAVAARTADAVFANI